MIQYRIEEATRARDDFKSYWNSVDPNEQIDEPRFNAITDAVDKDLKSMSHHFPATPDNASVSKTTRELIFLCKTKITTPSQCMRDILDAHESVHRAACSDDPLSMGWMNTQTVLSWLLEEVNSYQAEIDYMTKLLQDLACKCRRFGLLLNHSTSVTLLAGGASTDLHRFLTSTDDTGQGLFGAKIPVFVSDDGRVEGDAAGHETGWATLLAPRVPASGKSNFDAELTIQAQGTISPATGCTSVGCRSDDMLHIVLTGSQGNNSGQSHVQVGGFGKTKALTGGGGQGQIEFDLPAYVGESAEQEIEVPGTGVQAKVSVKIISLDHFEPVISDGRGTSLLFTAKECKEKP